ncbi:hypothetical protein DdX_03277 [Ditylenchus destructor]|uniref:Uncharacterized protein n=1 Tax=Ditylenchus destructor TaxID=166010 RepID=A0AAD4R9V8_9BILA|nr:hypothetical protein DdX_03277 [Ditylenchus destructor]
MSVPSSPAVMTMTVLTIAQAHLFPTLHPVRGPLVNVEAVLQRNLKFFVDLVVVASHSWPTPQLLPLINPGCPPSVGCLSC